MQSGMTLLLDRLVPRAYNICRFSAYDLRANKYARTSRSGDRISGQRERELSQNVFWTWLQEMRVFTKICGEGFSRSLINSILKSKLQNCFRDVSGFSTLFLEFQDRRRLKYSWQKRECVKIFYYPLQIKCSDLKKMLILRYLIWSGDTNKNNM